MLNIRPALSAGVKHASCPSLESRTKLFRRVTTLIEEHSSRTKFSTCKQYNPAPRIALQPYIDEPQFAGVGYIDWSPALTRSPRASAETFVVACEQQKNACTTSTGSAAAGQGAGSPAKTAALCQGA